MSDKDAAVADAATTQPTDHEGVLRALLVPRTIEEKMLRLIRQGRLAKWFSGYGQEAIAVGCTWALDDQDYILPMHRNLGVWTTRGLPLKQLFCQLMGKDGGFTNGRDRTFHFGTMEHRLVGMISHLAAMLPVACGLGLAAQLKKESFVALAFVGEGATREGDFHEALNLAAVWKLPVIFVIENNGYGLSTPTQEVLPIENLADAAAGYGMSGHVVDGNDVLAVMEAVMQAKAHATGGEGPTLLEMKTFRRRGHEEASGTKYVPQELMDYWAERDPVDRYVAYLREHDLVPQDAIDALKKELVEQVEQVAEYALAQPVVTTTLEKEREDLFAPRTSAVRPEPETAGERSIRFIDAITEALREVMEADERTLIMGQDIAEYGGVFKVTQDFVEAFGKERVRNTPIIESGAVGAAMGLALEGFRPVVEIQYADFISCGFNQIINNLATTHYRWGAPLNVTIRAPFGGFVGAGPFHSQSIEAWFCHTPGLKVVVPGSPFDAKGLLHAALADPNPVLFFEHKYLYRSQKGAVPEKAYEVPLGKARVVRDGTDVTIVTYGIGVVWALEEAAFQAEQGVSVEVVDLRTLVPWDQETVLTSLAKTNRLVMLHEATYTAGFGAEVCAQVAQVGFQHLDAPPMRVASEDLPVPFSIHIEKELFSAHAKLRAAVQTVVTF